ncbi:hypothetical protein B0H14DRAFT_1474630 [Mycena olivaceomarginata]|nr:hypothetical protein B0H14DRAFT_1474630 [Mycena olivaceomarginata]
MPRQAAQILELPACRQHLHMVSHAYGPRRSVPSPSCALQGSQPQYSNRESRDPTAPPPRVFASCPPPRSLLPRCPQHSRLVPPPLRARQRRPHIPLSASPLLRGARRRPRARILEASRRSSSTPDGGAVPCPPRPAPHRRYTGRPATIFPPDQPIQRLLLPVAVATINRWSRVPDAYYALRPALREQSYDLAHYFPCRSHCRVCRAAGRAFTSPASSNGRGRRR